MAQKEKKEKEKYKPFFAVCSAYITAYDLLELNGPYVTSAHNMALKCGTAKGTIVWFQHGLLFTKAIMCWSIKYTHTQCQMSIADGWKCFHTSWGPEAERDWMQLKVDLINPSVNEYLQNYSHSSEEKSLKVKAKE